jgi:hypothetical protein
VTVIVEMIVDADSVTWKDELADEYDRTILIIEYLPLRRRSEPVESLSGSPFQLALWSLEVG